MVFVVALVICIHAVNHIVSSLLHGFINVHSLFEPSFVAWCSDSDTEMNKKKKMKKSQITFDWNRLTHHWVFIIVHRFAMFINGNIYKRTAQNYKLDSCSPLVLTFQEWTTLINRLLNCNLSNQFRLSNDQMFAVTLTRPRDVIWNDPVADLFTVLHSSEFHFFLCYMNKQLLMVDLTSKMMTRVRCVLLQRTVVHVHGS